MELTATIGVLEGVVSHPGGAAATRLVESLYVERGRELWAFGRRLGLNAEECDDALQEAHLRLWSALVNGTGIDDPRAWVYRVFYRLAMDRHRVSRRVAALLRRWPTDEIDGGDRALSVSVWQAVDELPPRQRAAVYLHYRADLRFEEVALVMGIQPGAARTAASRGLDTVRRRLATTVEAGP